MKKNTIKLENWAQAEAFHRMEGHELTLIELYAADFRRIINEYESAHNGRVPSADDLLWIASEHRGHDITKLCA